MSIDIIASPVDVAISGLRAETLRMSVAANNIANSDTTKTDTGEPYRRQSVTLTTDSNGLTGVNVGAVTPDMSDFKRVLEPSSPDADANGYVRMPNVDLPTEMIQMMTASRSYQANVAVLKQYQEMVDLAIDILKS